MATKQQQQKKAEAKVEFRATPVKGIEGLLQEKAPVRMNGDGTVEKAGFALKAKNVESGGCNRVDGVLLGKYVLSQGACSVRRPPF